MSGKGANLAGDMLPREILLLCHFQHFDPVASQIEKKLNIGNCGILLAYFSDF